MTNPSNDVPAGYRLNRHGDLIRETNISPRDLKKDEIINKIMLFGRALHEQMARFKFHTFADILDYLDILATEYGVERRTKKGNLTLVTFDARLKVQLQVADVLDVGPEIRIAQDLINKCLDDWTQNTSVNIRKLVDHAFRADSTGRLSVSQLLDLRRIHIEDERWKKFQNAIADAITPTGTTEYVRLYEREAATLPWQPISLDLARIKPSLGAANNPQDLLRLRVQSASEEARYAGLTQAQIKDVINDAARKNKRPGEADQ